MESYISIAHAAKLKGVARVTVYRAVELGKLTRYERDGQVYVVEDDVFKAYSPAKREIVNNKKVLAEINEKLQLVLTKLDTLEAKLSTKEAKP